MTIELNKLESDRYLREMKSNHELDNEKKGAMLLPIADVKRYEDRLYYSDEEESKEDMGDNAYAMAINKFLYLFYCIHFFF